MKEFYNLSSNSDEDTLTIAINDDIGSFFGNDSDELSEILKAHPDVKNIKVEINTDGGSLFEGISMFNQLQSHPAHVETIVTGVAASAGSIVFMAGDIRTVQTGAFLMIHKPMAIGINNATEMRDKADQLDKFQDALIDIYETKVSISRDEISNLVNAETWLNASEAVEKGFATSQSIVEAEVVNKYDYYEYVNKHTATIPKDAKKYFKNQGKHKIQQVLNKLKETILNINPDKEDDMDKDEVLKMLADSKSEQTKEFSNKLDEVKVEFTNDLAKKDDVINVLKSQITELTNKSALSSIENLVDLYINSGKVALKDKANEIKNLKFRQNDKEEFESYKNDLSSRETLVDFTPDFANTLNGAERNTGATSGVKLSEQILNLTEGKELTADEMIAAAQQLHKKNGGK